jgi:hypothetical protein
MYGQVSPQPIVTTRSAPLGQLAGQWLRAAAGEVDAELVHHRDDLGVDATVRIGDAAGGCGGVAAVRRALEQRLAHLRAAGVIEAAEEDVAHGAAPVSGAGVRAPLASAGPNERAGFMLPPDTTPRTRMSTATVTPMASAAPAARVSVATATITNISTR